jgi:hypothetical protein
MAISAICSKTATVADRIAAISSGRPGSSVASSTARATPPPSVTANVVRSIA